jgi:hypothetical protein
MKKLIALLIGASFISTAAMAEDAQQAATPAKSDAVMQQLADNSSTASTDASASGDQAAAPAKKAKKACGANKHGKKHHAKKANAADANAPAADASAPASN